jgi:hypothetical protein
MRICRWQLQELHLSYEAGKAAIALPPVTLDSTELSSQTLNELVRNWKHDEEPTLTGDNIPRELAASGIEHRNLAENRAVYGV